MSSLYKEDANYLTQAEQSKRLHKDNDNGNRVDLTLASGVTAVTTATAPQARTTGNTVVYLTGKCDVGGTPALDMALATMPEGFNAHNIVHLPVTVESVGTFSPGSVKISGSAMTFDGTPLANDVIHFDGAIYLATGDV